MFAMIKKSSPADIAKQDKLTASKRRAKYAAGKLDAIVDCLASDDLSSQSREILKLANTPITKALKGAYRPDESSLGTAMLSVDVASLNYAPEPSELVGAVAKIGVKDHNNSACVSLLLCTIGE